MQTVELCVLIFVFGLRLFSVSFYATFLHISDLILKLLSFIAFYYRVISLTMGKMVASLTRRYITLQLVATSSSDSAVRGRSILRVITSRARVMENNEC